MNITDDIIIVSFNSPDPYCRHNNNNNKCSRYKISTYVCTLLPLAIVISGIISLAFVIQNGKDQMNASKKLVTFTEATAINNSNSYRRCGRRGCKTIFVTRLQYSFGNQTKNEQYESKDQYFENDKLYISISKSTGDPEHYYETKLYHEGSNKRSDGVIGMAVFTIIISPCILGFAVAFCGLMYKN